MPIVFQCSACRKDVTAPDAAVGGRGKCPHCGAANDIPPAPADDDLIPLAPLDEEEERRVRQEILALRQHEHDLLADTGGPSPIPLDQRDDLASEDLHHFVVNYCLDLAAGKLDRADIHVENLKKYGPMGLHAVEEFASGKVSEPALRAIPAPVLRAFLKQLREQVTGGD